MWNKRPISGTTEVDSFLDHTPSVSYKYKDPANSPTQDPAKAHGRFLGTIANEMEKTPYGRQIVDHTPGGRVLNGPPLLSALTAAAGRMHQRLDANEQSLAELHGLVNAQGQHHRKALSTLQQHEHMLGNIHRILTQKFGGPKPPRVV